MASKKTAVERGVTEIRYTVGGVILMSREGVHKCSKYSDKYAASGLQAYLQDNPQ